MTVTSIQNITPLGGDGATYREAPQNEEVEQALLGALLVNNVSFEKVCDYLRPAHFYSPVHGRIYEAIDKLINRGQDASPKTLKSYFADDEDLAHVGGGKYLEDLAANVISVVNAAEYGEIVYNLHIRRALINLGEDVVNEAYRHDLDIEPKDQIEVAERKLYELATTGDFKAGFVSLQNSLKEAVELAEKAYKSDGAVTGVTTGLKDLDTKLGGLHPSDLVILAARPSMGKTALAANIAFNAARAYAKSAGQKGGIVAFFSLEMSRDQLANRILSERVEIPSDKIRRGEVKQQDFLRITEAAQELQNTPLFIDDTPALSVNGLRTRARRLQRQHGLNMIVVDYLQLMQGTSRNDGNRVQEISEITRGLKTVAKELNVPVLALSQLSRAVEQRDNKRPQLSDLRESGSIEQDADVVMFIYRDQYYLEREEPSQRPDEDANRFNERHQKWMERCEDAHNVADVIIAKQRHGPIGTVSLFFEGMYTRFKDLDRQHNTTVDL